MMHQSSPALTARSSITCCAFDVPARLSPPSASRIVANHLDQEANHSGTRFIICIKGCLEDYELVAYYVIAFGRLIKMIGSVEGDFIAAGQAIVIAGNVGDDLGELHAIGLDAVFSLASGPMTLERSMADAAALLKKATEQALRCFMAGRAHRQ